MLDIVMSTRFRKDLKLVYKRGFDLDLLDKVINMIANNEQLPVKHKDHSLTGNYVNFREWHVAPDWLLVYRVDQDKLYLFLSRTGTHSDLF